MPEISQKQEQIMIQRLSPRQILLMKLLQIPTIMMEQRIHEELEANPALEEAEGNEDNREDNTENTDDNIGEEDTRNNEDDSQDTDHDNDNEPDLDLYYDDDDDDDYIPSSGNNRNEDQDEIAAYKENNYVSGCSYQENLTSQLNMIPLSEEDKELAAFIVGCIDDGGYISRSSQELVNDLLFSKNISTTAEHIEYIITSVIQHLEPIGTGARDLQECMMLQLQHDDTDNPVNELAQKIIGKYYSDFTKKHFLKIKQLLKCTDEEFDEALNYITTSLNPKPGESASFADEVSTIIPDFIVTIDERKHKLELTMPKNDLPELRISHNYQQMFNDIKGNSKMPESARKEAMEFIKQKVNAAQWFIEALSQREQTLYRTMSAIMEKQQDYFFSGDEMQIKPMILKDIATVVDADISTISRVVKQKYVLTPYGIIPLKFFFSESLTTTTGEEVSSHEIRRIITDAINGEDKNDPLNDQNLCELLNKKGYNVARRTVAKYREQLGYPVARMRK